MYSLPIDILAKEAFMTSLDPRYQRAIKDAQWMLDNLAEIEPRSAIKQAGADAGIAWGDDMAAFVRWAEHEMGLSDA